jgi:DNA-binding SARP family transcriptional activator
VAVRVAMCRVLSVARGDTELSGPKLGTRKARVLLAMLAAAHGRPVPTDLLTEGIWLDGGPPRDPQANLATLASRLRRVVGEDVVVPGASSYALGPLVELDLDVAHDLLAAATARLRRGEPTLAVASARRALELLGDGRLAEECGDWAAAVEREALECCRETRHVLATAAAAIGRSDLALAAAGDAATADPYDERAHRDLMRALVADGRPAAALMVYQQLAARLAEELGADPEPESRRLHLAILRGEPVAAGAHAAVAVQVSTLVGREFEVESLDTAWAAASTGHPSSVLVTGVPGIGKTRLLAEVAASATASGGLVLATACRPGERSLFLQPFLDVLRPVLLSSPTGTLEILLGSHLSTWGRLLPELTEVLAVPPEGPLSKDLARRRSFDAVVAVVAGLAATQPVLLALDDLQYGAEATADLLAHLRVQLVGAPVLLLSAARSESLPSLPQVTARSRVVHLGPLSSTAVEELAAAAGFGSRAAEVQSRTLGHPLSVVASLHALASGSSGVPEDIAAAVAGQLERLDERTAEIARGASVLGTRVDPRLVSGLVEQSEVAVGLAGSQLAAVGLLAVSGSHFSFVNDLVRDAVLATLARPLAVAYHRRAADLVADQPEEMAGHAHEAGDPRRAAAGYLEAGRRARLSGATQDARALLTLALQDARDADDPALEATVLLERAGASEACAAYEAAEDDVLVARTLLVEVAEPRLELRSLRLLAGDLTIARGRPLGEAIELNRAGIQRAGQLGDTVAAADFRTRIVVAECTRLQLARALDLAEQGVEESRASGDEQATASSLDGLKTVYSFLGDAVGLVTVLSDLLPLLDRQEGGWLRQWAVLESALVPAAAGRWQEALETTDRALRLNHETGYDAYAGFFRAQRAWLARLSGDLEAALEDGRLAVAQASPTAHPWWYAAAAGVQATTLLELGRPDEAASLAAAGLAALAPQSGAAYRLRCLAPLAAATGEGLEETDRLLRGVNAPAGRGWVLGADVYESVAAAWLAVGEPDRAGAAVAPLLGVTGGGTWDAVHMRLSQSSSPSSAAALAAPSDGTGT